MAAQGVYGIGVPANVTTEDVEIFFNYRQERSSDSSENAIFTKLPSSILVPAKKEIDTNEGGQSTVHKNDTSIPGMYNLKLPLDKFGDKGFYCIYIRPKEIACRIEDIGSLAAYPDVIGLVLNSDMVGDASIKTLMEKDNGLVGYRIEYYDSGKRMDYYRIITSSFKVEPVIQNLTNSNQKSVRYRYNASSNLLFLTVTPSTAPTYKPNALPFIGNAGQDIILINTKFNPLMLDIEMTEHDADTISTMLEGNQIRNLENGIMTTLDDNDEVYIQHEFYALKDSYTGDPIYEIKEKKESVDFSQTLENIKND